MKTVYESAIGDSLYDFFNLKFEFFKKYTPSIKIKDILKLIFLSCDVQQQEFLSNYDLKDENCYLHAENYTMN